MEDENEVLRLSFAFAVRIVRLGEYLRREKKEFILSKQLMRSGTSIGANVTEAQDAESKRDFISKISIALKEAKETRYWILLLIETDYLPKHHERELFPYKMNSIRSSDFLVPSLSPQRAV